MYSSPPFPPPRFLCIHSESRSCMLPADARHGGHLEATPVDPFPLLAAQSKQKEKKSKGLATAHSSSSSSSAAARAHRRLAGSASSSSPPGRDARASQDPHPLSFPRSRRPQLWRAAQLPLFLSPSGGARIRRTSLQVHVWADLRWRCSAGEVSQRSTAFSSGGDWAATSALR